MAKTLNLAIAAAISAALLISCVPLSGTHRKQLKALRTITTPAAASNDDADLIRALEEMDPK